MNSPKETQKFQTASAIETPPTFCCSCFYPGSFPLNPFFSNFQPWPPIGSDAGLPSQVPYLQGRCIWHSERAFQPRCFPPSFSRRFSQRKTESFRTWNLMFLYCTFAGCCFFSATWQTWAPQSPTVDGFFTGKNHLRWEKEISHDLPTGF